MRRVRPSFALLLSVPLLLSLGTTGTTAQARAPRVDWPALAAEMTVTPTAGRDYAKPGEGATVAGRLLDKLGKAVAGTVTLAVYDTRGTELGRLPGVRTAPDGTFRAAVPPSVTKPVKPTRFTNFREVLTVRAVDARAGKVSEDRAGVASFVVAAAAVAGLELENSFTSAVGWVKPGETYPFRVILRNYDAADDNIVVTVPEADGMRLTKVETGPSAGSATLSGGTITWTIASIPAGSATQPEERTLIVEGQAKALGEDPKVVWKDISTTASLEYDGGEATSTSHGPKVIPPDELYDTARYGDRPFPVVPVDFYDGEAIQRKHEPEHTSELLAKKINDPAIKGSTFNLFQEMSFGQLYPHGTVPSAGATGEWPDEPVNFTDPDPPVPNGCPPDGATTFESAQDTAVYPTRIEDSWYRLPGTFGYYGTDRYGPFTGFAGAVAGQSILFDIDSACGPTGKAVYDAAAIADPEIDYSDYDTDKDGIVDFFMMVYAGVGGHGQSQTSVPPYDNIWPHSSSLEFYYEDDDTGLTGYVSKDQLKDLNGRPLWYTNDNYSQMTTEDKGEDLVVRVRVGPYNVNPESAIDKASVISHEYGHSLGLPDFYSTGDRDTYGDWNLMATDKSQNMDIFSKQDMGWIVPRVLPKNDTHTAEDWKDSKVNTHQIDWMTPDGDAYTLSGSNVQNGEAYTVKLRGRQLISPEKIEQGASPTHVWWSGSGNDFGCAPEKGHNFDISLPELEDVPDSATVTLKFNSYWDIEWDYDYGFVLITSDNGRTYKSVPSENGYTTPSTQNPNANGCQTRYGNGITGTSGSYEAGTAPVDRLSDAASGTQYPDGPFLADEYDISELAGAEQAVVRFSYATDPGLAHPGWFVDDVVVEVDGEPIYSTDFEDLDADRERIFNGGCQETLQVAVSCTKGWQWISSDADATADHGYYLEMRDRSGFDYDGKDENDRAAIAFDPGLLLVYTDEAHGYGNAGTDDPPAQSPLDQTPTPGSSSPNLNDAAFNEGDSFSDGGWVDNYEDPSTESGNWEFRFNCLRFTVDSMSGDDIGPDTPVGVGGDLVGDVTFRTTASCAEFNYGFGGDTGNFAPTAKLAVKPATPRVGQPVTFDASESYDDHQASNDLTYTWDFGDGTTGKGRSVSHTYAKPDTYTVTLTVTDADGAKTTITEDVAVSQETSRDDTDTDTDLPATGGSAPLALLAVLGSAAAVLIRRRAARAA